MIPAPEPTDALFLDFDGTLVEIALHPSDVIVSDALLTLLTKLDDRLAGALAIISGRPVADLDQLLTPLKFATAGEHGAEVRHDQNAPVLQSASLPQQTATAARSLSASLAGTDLEVKTVSAALHYRKVPEHGPAAIAGMQALAAQIPGYELLQGKMVAEMKPSHIDKGSAVRDFMNHPPFAGRRPVYIGDDVTDEAGFVAVNELGGISMRVGGCQDSTAVYGLDNVKEAHEWLARLV